MADTQPLAPTDDELDELRQANSGRLNFVTFREFRVIARAALAKWGAPAAVAGPVVNRITVIEWLDANDIEVTDRQMDGLFHFAAPTTHPAPKQEAQKPVMIYHGDCTIDCGEHGHHHVELLRMIPAGSKLYTAPQPVALEPLTDEQTKALMQAHRTAMLMTCKARAPECGEFAAIAQDLDWLCESFGIKGGQHGTE